ncbi:sugar-binding domain-containing protein [Pseudonocardia nematodicida]|uniref:Sugar-binding domain-containing protein n=1 Tax=Pseudonocardia nematodicida TaxID=1206997 RepID=A0ABV1K569_9PSEU
MNDHPIPRPEHPRPQLYRPEWRCLNGEWEFEVDLGDSGLERGLRTRELAERITVPFAPESELSGIGRTDFMEAVWYARTVDVPAGWDGHRVLLHFGAVDHDATVWADDVEVARHRGGFSSFTADITEHVTAGGPVRIVVRARDSRHDAQARGKQATWYENSHAQYTRTTGIWQTVWLEAVPAQHVVRLQLTPDLAGRTLTVGSRLSGNHAGHEVVAVLSDAAGTVAEGRARADLDLAPSVALAVPDDRLRPWNPQDPFLYDLVVTLLDGDGAEVDRVQSYAGMRSVAVDGRALLLNGEPVFQRLVLDQGYWPQSLMTAPSDADLVRDIELGLRAGFNGARLHQKVFEERYLYHADRLGYLVWGEFGDWGVRGLGVKGHNQQPTASFVTQWLEVLERDRNHPSIVGWCPLNETDQALHDRITVLDDVTRAMFLATKLADPTRPVIDASGYSHRVPETDVYDSHSYEQDPEAFREQVAWSADGSPYVNLSHAGDVISVDYAGQPYFLSEFGGIWWDPDAAARDGSGDGEDAYTSWGYGTRVRDEEGFHRRFEGLTGVLLADPRMFGYCYTQLTDVMQEQNGIYRFDRGDKLDVERVRKAQLRPAAYEDGDRRY